MSTTTIATFDIIRAVAAQMVVVGHALSTSGSFPLTQPPKMPFLQNIGVVVFFAISGFLICRTARENARRRPTEYGFPQFLMERATRIYSGLIPALIFILVVDLICRHFSVGRYEENFTVRNFIGNLAFLQGFPLESIFRHAGLAAVPNVEPFGSGRPLWTLAIEWWLYVFFGALFLRWPVAAWARVGVLGLFVISAPLIFLHLVDGEGAGLCAVWFIGAAAVWLLDIAPGRIAATRLLPIGLLIGGALLFLLPRMALAGYDFQTNTFIALGLIWLLICAQAEDRDVLGVPARKIAQFFASYSYSLYLVHYSLMLPLKQGLGGHPALFISASVILANLAALVVAACGEFHYKKLRALFGARGARPLPEVTDDQPR